jgi:YggT family protein
MLFWVLVIRAILSWFSQGYNPVEAMLHQITEPLLAPVRKILPPIGGLDLSVLVVIIGLQFLRILIGV